MRLRRESTAKQKHAHLHRIPSARFKTGVANRATTLLFYLGLFRGNDDVGEVFDVFAGGIAVRNVAGEFFCLGRSPSPNGETKGRFRCHLVTSIVAAVLTLEIVTNEIDARVLVVRI